MRIREHTRSPNNRWCYWCGAFCNEADGTWPSGISCNEREDGISEKDLRPEPKRREYAIDDIGTISGRIAGIRTAEQPRCPISPDRTLYDCLRSSAKCSTSCEFVEDWIGPQA